MTPFSSTMQTKSGPEVAPVATFSHPTWACARKDIVGASLGPSRLWFSCGRHRHRSLLPPRRHSADQGPRLHRRRRAGFWVEVAGSAQRELARPGIPAVEIVHRHPRFVFTLQVCPSRAATCCLSRRLQGDARSDPMRCCRAPGRRRGRAMSRRSRATAAGRRCGRSRGLSAWRCWRPTSTGADASARFGGLRGRATAGRISTATNE